MSIPTWGRWFARKPSADPGRRPSLRVGLPKVLNIWSTHQFGWGFLTALGLEPEDIVFSSDTSDEQGREFGKGRGTVDCCYPVKCMSGHYGELLFGQKKKLDVLLARPRPGRGGGTVVAPFERRARRSAARAQ